MGPSNILRYFLLTATGILLALLMVELPAFFNVVDYRRLYWLSGDHFDSEFRTMHRPHSQIHGAALGGLAATLYKIPRSEMLTYQWDAKYDANGFRNDTDLKRADVAVVGASFVEGMTVPSATLMTSVLARETGTVVANLGQNNFAPQQDLMALKRYALPLQPRTVIWMFTDFNDLRQVLYYRGAIAAPPSRWAAFVDRSFSTFAYQRLRPYFVYHCPGSQFRDCAPDGAIRSGLVPDEQGKMIRIYFTHAPEPMNAVHLIAVNDMRSIFTEAYKLTSAQGARLLVVFLPESFRVFRPFARFPANSLCLRWTENDEPERIEAAVRSISPNIGYLDLTPVMQQAVSKGAIPYFKDDNHWSPVGQKIAAEAIGDYLAHAQPYSPGNLQF